MNRSRIGSLSRASGRLRAGIVDVRSESGFTAALGGLQCELDDVVDGTGVAARTNAICLSSSSGISGPVRENPREVDVRAPVRERPEMRLTGSSKRTRGVAVGTRGAPRSRTSCSGRSPIRAGGDARSVHNIVELALQTAEAAGERLSEAHVDDAARKRPLLYDKTADAHYDFISAFIKSMRDRTPTQASTTSPRCSKRPKRTLHPGA